MLLKPLFQEIGSAADPVVNFCESQTRCTVLSKGWPGARCAASTYRMSPTNSDNPFRYFHSSPEVIRLVVMMYVRFPLSLRNVEDLLLWLPPVMQEGCDPMRE